MRAAIMFLLCTSLHFSFAQAPPAKAQLQFESYAFSFCATPSGKVIVATRAGEVAITEKLGNDWRKHLVKITDKVLRGPLIDDVNFFNNDTGFVSGYIGKTSDIIYRTDNGGATWHPLVFGKGGWVDDAVSLTNGEAWMSVSKDGFYYTSDFAKSWQRFENPKPQERFTRIFFNSLRQGLIGANNTLMYTGDNCATWKVIPTPLDEQAYSKTNIEAPSNIEQLAILPDKFIIRQDDLVFWSPRDKIKWTLLLGYRDFYTDPDGSTLFFKKGQYSIVKAGNDLSVLKTIELQNYASHARVVNEKLYLFSGSEICEVGDDTVKRYPLVSSEFGSITPSVFGYNDQYTYGNIGSAVYIQKAYQGPWEYVFTLPFATGDGKLTMKKDVILYANGDSLVYYNLSQRNVKHVSRLRMFQDFSKAEIQTIRFEEGSRGCFHGYTNGVTYTVDNCGYFNFSEEDLQDKRAALPAAPEEIDGRLVEQLVVQLPQLITVQPSIATLDISESDYRQCKADILEFKRSIGKKGQRTAFFLSENNIDFDRLLSLVDSLRSLPPEQLDKMLYSPSMMMSTTSNWTAISLTNARGETLIIRHQYYEDNPLLFPWTFTLQDYSITANAIAVTNFIKDAYPGLIKVNNKVEILHSLVQQLY
jgi:photosystem II stability/assembly factor-like uncharacterized protein